MGFGRSVPEPGNKVGPTTQGMRRSDRQDPNAYWDNGTNKVVSTMHPARA